MPKWFRVATEGATTDGRNISRQWIEEMASTYSPSTYGARIWLEHMRGLYADGPFRAYGDVLAVDAREYDDGKLGLYVQLDPTDDLVEMNKQRQKVYSSIEVDPEFADTGAAYLMGVAVTDSPASLGTEMLQFSAQMGERSPLAHRKQNARCLFTAAEPLEIDFSGAGEEPPADPGENLLSKVKNLFRRAEQKADQDTEAFREDLEQTLEHIAERFADLHRSLDEGLEQTASQEKLQDLEQAHQELSRQFRELRGQLDNTPDTRHRAPATGGEGGIETDC